MARLLRHSQLETRAARGRLKARGKPYWRLVEEGLHVGYRKPRGRPGRPAAAGKWVVRRYIGQQNYAVETIAEADDYSDADGNTILNFRQAQELARERGKQLGEGGRRGRLRVAAVFADYLLHLEGEGRAAHNIRDTRYRAEAFILPELGDVYIADLTTNRLRRWRDALAKTPARLRTRKGEKQKYRDEPGTDAERRRRASTNRTWSILLAALNHAFREGAVNSDIEWRRLKPFAKVQATRQGHLTVAEARRVINAADPASGFRDLVQAALYTGCRYGELCALRVSDFHRGKIAVHQSKSGKPRDVVLNGEAIAFFEQLTAGRPRDEIMLRNRGRIARAQGKPVQDAGARDDGAWRKSEQLRLMAEVCERAKIAAAIGFHQLRHTWASLAVMNDMPMLVVARNLGHADTRMVERHYGHLAPSFVDDAIRAGAPQFGFKADKKIADLAGRDRR